MRSYLKNTDTDTLVTRYVNFNKKQELNLTVQTALDGTEYLTRFGSPVLTYTVECWVTGTGRDLLMSAAASLALMEVKVNAGTYTGRIKELGEFEEEHYGWYKTTLLLSSVSEVTDR